MKRFALLLLIPAFLVIAPKAHAAAKKDFGNKTVTLGAEEVVDGNYYAAGETIEILGTVNGDVYAVGGQVLVKGTVNGDLITAGGVVDISGYIDQDVRVAGGQVSINAAVGKNLSAAGGNVLLSETASVGNALQVAAGTVIVKSSVGSETMIAAGSATIEGKLNGSLEAKVGNLRISPNAAILGNVDYWSPEEANISQAAGISGSITKHLPVKNLTPSTQKQIDKFVHGADILSKLLSITTTLIIGLILIKAFPNCTSRTLKALRQRPWASLGIGFASIILVPVASVLLILTLFGTPLGILSLIIFATYLFYARIYVIIALGDFLMKKLNQTNNSLISLLIGIVIYYALTSLPLLGSIVKLITVFLGVGSGLIAARKTYSLARLKKVF
jgi:cytoskeletal protein CcmA (bactofilin family)